MAKTTLEELQEQREREQQEVNEYEQAVGIARGIADLQRKKSTLQLEVNKYLTQDRPEAGTIKRMTAVLGGLSGVNAIYQANEAAIRKAAEDSNAAPMEFVKTFTKQYAKDIGKNALTAITGKDYTQGNKTYKDIITKQMGAPDNAVTTVAGVIGDITIDANIVGGLKPLFSTVRYLGNAGIKFAKQSPILERGMNAIEESFNIFAQIEKTRPAQEVEKFKNAFREMVATKDPTKMEQFGFNLGRTTGQGSGGSITRLYEDIVEKAFTPGAKRPTSQVGQFLDDTVGVALDKTSGFFKSILSWSPKFQTRNFMGALTQNIGEGVGAGSYWDAAKLLTVGKGSPRYERLEKAGVLSQPGMFEQTVGQGTGIWQTIKDIPATIATWGESLHRTAMVFNEAAKGTPFLKAVEKTEKVFYKYGSEYLTPVEEAISKVLPFYKFQKGQMGYMPGFMEKNPMYYSAWGKTKEATSPNETKDYPALTPEWFQNMFTVGSVGNIGFQAEDFFKNATLNVQNIWGQVAPLIKTMTEGVTNYKVFADKKMSTDTEGRKYAGLDNLPVIGPAIQAVVGYDRNTKTVNAIMKWLTDTWLGPVIDGVTTALDPKKGPLRAMFSFREYDTGLGPTLRQSEMDRREKGKDKWGWGIFDQMGMGNPLDFSEAKASEIPQDALSKYRADLIASFDKETAKKNLPSGLYDTKLVRSGAPGEQRMDADFRFKMMDDAAKALMTAGPDIGKNIAASHGLTLEAMMKKADFYGFTSHPDFQKLLAITKTNQAFLAPRALGGLAAFGPQDMKFRKQLTGNYAQDYNKAFEEMVEWSSKTSELFRSAFMKSPETIKLAKEAAEEGAKRQYAGGYGGISEDAYQKRLLAIQLDAQHALDDLKAKSITAMGNILENMADAEVEGIRKIDLQHQASLKKYQGSEEYRRALAAKNAEEINLAVAAIDAKYSEKRRGRLADEAKAHAEAVSNMLKDQGSAIVAALEDTYKRGGMSIEEFFGKKTQQATNQFIRTALTDITTFQSQMKGPGFAEGTTFTLGKIEGQMPSKESIDAMTSQVQAIIYASKSMDELVSKLKELGTYSKAEQQGITIDIASSTTKKMEDFKQVYENFDKFRLVLIDLLSDPKTKPDKVITILKEIADAMSGALKTGDYKELAASWKKMNDNATGIGKIIPDIQKDSYEATKKFKEATFELQRKTAELMQEVYQSAPVMALGVTSYPATGGAKYGTVRTPRRPIGYDENAERLKAELKKQDEESAKSFSGADIGAAFKLPERKTGEDALKFMTETEDRLVIRRKEVLDELYILQDQEGALNEKRVESYKDSLDRIDKLLAMSAAANEKRNIIIVKSDEQVMQQRISAANDMAGTLGKTAEMLYDASGKQSKEMFYLWKAAAYAQALVQGISAVISAFASGSKINVAFGYASAAIAGAFVATQLALIQQSMFKGPPDTKAEGGKIEGGSGVKDDVQVWAMGGEYVIQKKAVKQYGIAFMDALNKGQVELAHNIPENINASITNISKKSTYAEGGLVVPERESKETLIVLENKTGAQMKMTDNGTKFDGKKMVRSIIFDLVDTDPTFVNMMRGSGR